jgi:carbon storage regulator
MLVLSRYKDQQILIGHEIVVTVVDVDHERARLGIAAPRDIPIWRREIYESIMRENAAYQAKLDAEDRLKRGIRGGLQQP